VPIHGLILQLAALPDLFDLRCYAAQGLAGILRWLARPWGSSRLSAAPRKRLKSQAGTRHPGTLEDLEVEEPGRHPSVRVAIPLRAKQRSCSLLMDMLRARDDSLRR
jgi:hypothetical protein